MIGVGCGSPRGGGSGGGVGTLTIGVFSDSGHTIPVSSGVYGDTFYLQVTGTGLTDATWYVNGCEIGAGLTIAYDAEWLGDVEIEVVATNGSSEATDSDTITISEILPDTLIQINESSTYTLNGADVSAAENLGTGVDAVQATVSRQPLYVASGINSLPSVDYSNGSADHLFAAGAINADCTITMVVEPSSTNQGSLFWIASTYNNGGTFFIGLSIQSGNFVVWDRFIGGGTTPFSITIGQKLIVQLRQAITKLDFIVNGTYYRSINSLDGGDRSTGMFIGGGFHGNFEGEVGHTELVNRAITDQELKAKELNLKAKWGLTY